MRRVKKRESEVVIVRHDEDEDEEKGGGARSDNSSEGLRSRRSRRGKERNGELVIRRDVIGRERRK